MLKSETRLRFLGAALAAGLCTAALAHEPEPARPLASATKLAFRVGKVVTMDAGDTITNNALVLVADGKIESIAPARDAKIPDGYTVVDRPELWLVPGLVDCHNHVAGSLSDLNDMVYLTNPGLDSRATIEPNNDLVKRARRGGVTTMMLIPGSGTNMSGFGTVAKSGGNTPDDVIVRSPGSLKIAQAGNPEWYFGGVGRRFMNWNTRQTLLKALKYHLDWEAFEKGNVKQKPDFDPIFDNFRGLFRREFPVTVHTQIYQVVLTSVTMLSKQLKLWVVLDHSEFDGWKVAPEVLSSDVWTIQGPRAFHYDRTMRRMCGNADGWWKNGVRKLGLNTDAPVIPQEELSYQATMGCWYGWIHYPALCSVTKVPSQALGLYDKSGSIEPGKQADFGLWTGSPIDPRSACLLLVVNGNVTYDASAAPARQF